MIKIGVTGGIGSGKTTVCRIFETLGVPVFYADSVAKQVMVSDQELIAAVKLAFGTESYTDQNKLNNKHIAGIVFNNSVELAKLNAIVHPAVFRAFDRWLDAVPLSTAYVLKEAALLFESGSNKSCDKTILVLASKDSRLERVMNRDGLNEGQVLARMDKQMSDSDKLKLADFRITNDEDHSLILQVMELHHQFLNTTT